MDSAGKKDRFKRLAQQRTNIVLKRLKVLGNCANRSAYEYTEGEINKIFAAIDHQESVVTPLVRGFDRVNAELDRIFDEPHLGQASPKRLDSFGALASNEGI